MEFISHLKERKVFQTLAVYLGTGWVAVEALAFFSEKYGWPQNIIDVIILAIFFGLPSALVHAWFHGQAGKQKVKKREMVLHSVVGVIACVFIFNSLKNPPTSGPPPGEAEDHSIAILPLEVLSEDESNKYFADGVTEAIRGHLGKIGNLKVTSRNSVEQYRGTEKRAPEIAEEIGVRHILTGSFQRHEDQIRIMVQLVDAQTDKQLWAETFDRLYNDVLELQSDIALQIASQLDIQLNVLVKDRINKRSVNNVEAYNLYLKGQYSVKTAVGSDLELQKAIVYYQEAIALEPDFALAWAAIANAYMYQTYWGRAASSEVLPSAIEAVDKALSIDKEAGECYQAKGMVSFFNLEFNLAIEHFQRAIDLNPNHAEAYFWLAHTYHVIGDLGLSMNNMDKAIELDPVSLFYPISRAYILTSSREFAQAEEVLMNVLKTNDDSHAKWMLGHNYANSGKYEEAIKTLQERKGGSANNWILGYVYGKSGKTEDAEKVLDYLVEKNKNGYAPPYMIAILLISLDRKEEALDWLEKGLKDGPVFSYIVEINGPKLAPLKNEPRFKTLVGKFTGQGPS